MLLHDGGSCYAWTKTWVLRDPESSCSESVLKLSHFQKYSWCPFINCWLKCQLQMGSSGKGDTGQPHYNRYKLTKTFAGPKLRIILKFFFVFVLVFNIMKQVRLKLAPGEGPVTSKEISSDLLSGFASEQCLPGTLFIREPWSKLLNMGLTIIPSHHGIPEPGTRGCIFSVSRKPGYIVKAGVSIHLA